MVFAGIMMGYKTPLYFIQETLDGKGYTSLIEDVITDCM
jgi:hypothetical protein